jgi:hypothetical protein
MGDGASAGNETKTQVQVAGTLEADERGVVLAPGARLVDVSGRKRYFTGSGLFGHVFPDGVYVDKSLFVRDVLQGAQAKLFCRPRRFGKTLALSMLKDFLECAPCGDPEARSRFELLDIWEVDGGEWRVHQGRYPVVRLSFGCMWGSTWEEAERTIAMEVAHEYGRHYYLLEDGDIDPFDRAQFKRIAAAEGTQDDLDRSLLLLTDMLHAYHKQRAVVLIDEYDAPTTHAQSYGFYREAADFMGAFLGNVLKDNPHLERGVLIGIQQAIRGSIQPALNNVDVNTPLDRTAEERFGFTQAEVDALAGYLGYRESLPLLREWCFGYRFGEAEMYNPWSVLGFFDGRCVAQPYWTNTSGNSILAESFASRDEGVVDGMLALLEPGAVIDGYLEPTIAYGDLPDHPYGAWSVLYMSGYLTTDDTSFSEHSVCRKPLRVPNREILQAYRHAVSNHANKALFHAGRGRLYKSLMTGDEEWAGHVFEDVARDASSAYDLGCDANCRALVMGMLVDLYWRDYASVELDRGAGRGEVRARALPKAASAEKPPVLDLGFRFCGEDGEGGGEDLAALAREALAQVAGRAPDVAFEGAPCVRWGIALCGERAAVACEKLGF